MTRPLTHLISCLFVASITLALKVTPNSPCMSFCTDDQNNQSIDGTEIVCQDDNFMTTTPGQKFKACITCLQLSTAAGDSQNDQNWFMYNIRYSLASCLYGFANATDSQVTPCSTSSACGTLRDALGDGNFDPNETAYGYCGADYASMMGSTATCRSCLRNGGSETYLSNFVTALQAGCHQQPPDGTIVGLNGSVFSQYAIVETSPGGNYNTTTVPTRKSKHLAKKDIIGISVGLGLVLLASLFIMFRLWKRFRRLSRSHNLHSPLDERYEAANITSPNAGAFSKSQIQTRTISSAPPPRTRKNSQSLFKKSLSDDESSNRVPPPIITSSHDAHLAHPPPAYTPPQDHIYPQTLPTKPQLHHLFTIPTIPQRNPSRRSHLSPSEAIDRNTTSHARGSIAGTQHSAITYRNSIVSTTSEIEDLESTPPVGRIEFRGRENVRMGTGIDELEQRSSSRARGRSRERFGGNWREVSREIMNGDRENELERREGEWNAARLGKINGRDRDGDEEEQWPGSF
ncbi:hypothetical protein ACMFMG_005051 [Clarireedia jacksonii]